MAVGSLHVIADAGVESEAVQRTAFIITQMLANRPDVIEQMARWTYVVVGKTQLPISTVPEVRALPQRLIEEWDVDMDRIIGGGWGPSVCLGCEGGGAAPFTMVSEAGVLCSGPPIDTHPDESTVVHELVHGIHSSFELEQESAGIGRDNPASFDYQLQQLYEDAMASGFWEGHYAATNNREYFAEMFQYWSGTNDNDHVWVSTVSRPFDLFRQRDELAAYDPSIAKFLAEYFGEVPVTGSCHYYQGSDSLDRSVLAALYHATDGENWKNNSKWMSEWNIRDWHGVAMDSKGRVTELWLGDNNLSGSIPAELGGLANLTSLGLTNNQLTGTIPAELGDLANLVELHLWGNQLTGTIPAELGDLANLTILDLNGNQLTGTVPDSFLDLVSLESFYFVGNHGLCATPTDAFMTWLNGISFHGNWCE